MTRFRSLALALAVAGLLPAGAALASSDEHHESRGAPDGPTPSTAPVTLAAAVSAVEGAGYSGVGKVEWEHGSWQVRARDSQGRLVELRVDAAKGTVTPSDR